MTCGHDLNERENAVMADGHCPLCLAQEVKRLTAQVEELQSEIVSCESEINFLRSSTE